MFVELDIMARMIMRENNKSLFMRFFLLVFLKQCHNAIVFALHCMHSMLTTVRIAYKDRSRFIHYTHIHFFNFNCEINIPIAFLLAKMLTFALRQNDFYKIIENGWNSFKRNK